MTVKGEKGKAKTSNMQCKAKMAPQPKEHSPRLLCHIDFEAFADLGIAVPHLSLILLTRQAKVVLSSRRHRLPIIHFDHIICTAAVSTSLLQLQQPMTAVLLSNFDINEASLNLPATRSSPPLPTTDSQVAGNHR